MQNIQYSDIAFDCLRYYIMLCEWRTLSNHSQECHTPKTKACGTSVHTFLLVKKKTDFNTNNREDCGI